MVLARLQRRAIKSFKRIEYFVNRYNHQLVLDALPIILQ